MQNTQCIETKRINQTIVIVSAGRNGRSGRVERETGVAVLFTLSLTFPLLSAENAVGVFYDAGR